MGNIQTSCACAEKEEPPFSNFLEAQSPADKAYFIQTNPLTSSKIDKSSRSTQNVDPPDSRALHIDTEDQYSDESVMTMVSPTKDRSPTKHTKPPKIPKALAIASSLKGGIALDVLGDQKQDIVYLKPNDEVFKTVVIGTVQQLEEILLRRNLKLSQICWEVTGYTVLHLAVIEERVDMIKYCLANGVNVCHKDKLGRTALHLCYMSTNIRVLDTLINFLESQDRDPLTPYSPYARSSQRLGSPHSQSEMTSITMTSALLNTEDQLESSDEESYRQCKETPANGVHSSSMSSVTTEERKKKHTTLRLVRKAASRLRKALLTHNT